MSDLPPGVPWTATARSLFKWIPFLGEAETKLVFALYELTYGNGLLKGAKLHYADLVAATGLSNASVRRSVRTLAARGAIVFKPNTGNTRLPMPFKVILDWVPTTLPKSVVDTDHATKERGRKSGDSHLNHATKERGPDHATKERGTTLLKSVVLSSKSKTPKLESPLTSFGPQGGKKGEAIGDHPETIEECQAWHSEHGFTAVQADDFWQYHEMNGWRQGKAQAPIKKWTAAAHYFHRPKEGFPGGGRASPPPPPNGYRPPVPYDRSSNDYPTGRREP